MRLRWWIMALLKELLRTADATFHICLAEANSDFRAGLCQDWRESMWSSAKTAVSGLLLQDRLATILSLRPLHTRLEMPSHKLTPTSVALENPKSNRKSQRSKMHLRGETVNLRPPGPLPPFGGLPVLSLTKVFRPCPLRLRPRLPLLSVPA